MTPSASPSGPGCCARRPGRCPASRSARTTARRAATCWPTSWPCSADDAGLQWQALAARLAARFPERWDDTIRRRGVRRDARAAACPSVGVKADGQVARGCRLAAVEAAAAAGDPLPG